MLRLGFVLLMIAITNDLYAVVPKSPQSPLPLIDSLETKSTKAEVDSKKSSGKEKSPVIGTISTEVEGDLTIVTVRLNQKPNWQNIELEEHGTFLQIKLPKTQIPASGEFIDGNGPYLKKIATFQLPGDDGAVRFFMATDAAKVKLATAADILGDRIVVTIDHKKLEQLIAPVSTKPETTAQDIVAKTNVDHSLPAPSEQMSKQEESFGGGDSSEFYNKLARVAGFCAILFLGLIVAQFIRQRNKANGSPFRSKHEHEPLALKVISSVSIGAKQKLTLVQVGSQQILIGVSPESINLLTNIESTTRTNDFSLALEAANPNATVRLKSMNEIKPAAKQDRKPLPTATIQKPAASPKGQRINVGIDDQGISHSGSSSVSKPDDITKILRDRLKNISPRV